MGKTVFTLTRATYEPPYVAIIEFTVEGGFSASDGYNDQNGTETIGREDVTDPWHS